MERIQTLNREVDKFGPGKDGFRSAVPGVSEPTYLSADWCNGVQESLLRVIEGARLVPDASYTQFMEAIKVFIGDAIFKYSGSGKVVSLADYPTLRAAIDALPPEGGIVDIPDGRFVTGFYKYDTDTCRRANIYLRGAVKPVPSYNCDRLVEGAILEGRFNVWADNFRMSNLGFDCGRYVVDKYFGGRDTHSPDHPYGDTWDCYAMAQPNQNAPERARRGFFAQNIVCLNRDSQSYGHAFLLEGVDGAVIDNVVGIGGIHGSVVKSRNVTGGILAGYAASGNHVIFKSDHYAHCGNINLSIVESDFAPPGTSPWWPKVAANFGLLLNPATDHMDAIKVGNLRLYGANCLLGGDGPVFAVPLVNAGDPIYNLDNVMISATECEGTGVASPIGIYFKGANYYRMRLGTVTIGNVSDGIAFDQTVSGFGSDPLQFDSLTIGGPVALRAVQALRSARIVIDRFRVNGSINVLYDIADTAGLRIGREELVGAIATKWGRNPPTLHPGWEHVPGGADVRIILSNYGVSTAGLVRPVAGGSVNVVSLPLYLRSAQPTRRLAYGQGVGNTNNAVLVNIDSSYPYLALNNLEGITGAEMQLSLDGLSWFLD